MLEIFIYLYVKYLHVPVFRLSHSGDVFVPYWEQQQVKATACRSIVHVAPDATRTRDVTTLSHSDDTLTHKLSHSNSNNSFVVISSLENAAVVDLSFSSMDFPVYFKRSNSTER